MKQILITGKNSYVGNSFANWVSQYPEKYQVEKISLRNDDWKKQDFSKFDVVLHVAGIAHVSRNPKLEAKYYQINRDLTIEIAKKAKNDGVKQFIFMSSIIVYGDGVGKDGLINEHTIPKPRDFYGMSKLQAEKGIEPLNDEHFKIAIVRPPMIYGKNSKGNFPKLAKIARISPIFPDIENRRSMLHIDNLCEFLRLIIDDEESGLFFPQNKEYVKTSEIVKYIAEAHHKKIRLVKWFNLFIKIGINKINLLDKIFGNLIYDKSLSSYKKNYHIRNLKESIMKTEINNRNTNKIDLLIVTDNCLETVGGEQESTKIIIQGIQKYYNIGVIQPGLIKNKLPNVYYFELTKQNRIKHLIKKPFSFLNYFINVWKIIRNANPKIIHTQAQVSLFMVALLKKLYLISNNFKFIHTERGLYTKYNKFFKWLFTFFMKELDILVTTTEFNYNHWNKVLREKNINLSYKIIENTAGQLFEYYDEKLEKRDSNLIIGFAGRYTDWKNWPLAVEISKRLNKILGEKLSIRMAVGCLDKRAEVETLQMFKELNNIFGDRFKGMINVNIEEMNRFYYDLDIFILTSKHNTESFGRTLIEAMSRKTVVLTTNAGGPLEIVDNTENVLHHPDDFVNRILYFYNNKSMMNKEKQKNLLRFRSKYSLENNIKKHLMIYREIIK